MTTPLRKFLSLSPTRDQLEDWCQQRTRVVPAGDYNLCRVLGSKLIYAHQRDYALMPHLAMHGVWEPWVTMAIARHVKPGMRCLDVGACFGYFTLLLEELVSNDGYVEAWEPLWYEALGASLRLNGARAVALPYAMGTGQLPPLRAQHIPAAGWFNAGNIVGHPQNYVDVVTRLPAYNAYDFIKIDVEGAEVDVWASLLMGRCLYKPGLVVCMEFTPDKHENPQRDLEHILAQGFTMGSVGHDGVPRPCSIDEALVPDTGDFRMLWLTRGA